MQLYTFFRSSTSYRLRIALAWKGIAYEPHFVSLPKREQRDPAFLALNPQGLLPLLVDGDLRLTQSMAIIEWLDETHPEPPLMPRDPRARAHVRSVSQAIGCEIHPLNNVRALRRLEAQFGADKAAQDEWYRHWIAEGLGPLETYLAGHPLAGAFCCGEAVSMADVCLVPQIFNARRYACPLAGYPTLMAIFERCMALPAFADTEPGGQLDAF